MKKYIVSPLCSALVIPGLGQILNNRIKKGVIIMSLIFILFIAITVKLAFLVISQIKNADIDAINNLIENTLLNQDLSTLWVLIILFLILWLYSIVDAFIDGMNIEKIVKGEP